jgi:transcriptional regulator with XRE-family HTH domain
MVCPMPAGQIDQRLARTLRARREQQSISQEHLALEAGITVGSLSRIECGLANPRWGTVLQIAEALHLDLLELAAAVKAQPPA